MVPLTLAAQSSALAKGELSATELAETALASAQSTDAKTIFTHLTSERALAAARAADRRAARLGPLDGIPIAWKDLFDQSGEQTRAASPARDDVSPAQNDAVIVSLLEHAGAVSIGRTNLTQFAFSGLGLNPATGTPHNAWSSSAPLAPGGSSSGSALAVARGIVPLAMGTDTSGSVRVPAALNGLVGFKPGSDRISRIGVYPLAPTLDCVGPIAHTVEDLCLALSVMGFSVPQEADAPLLVVPEGPLTNEVSQEVAGAFDEALERLAGSGLQIVRRSLSGLDAIAPLFRAHGTLVGLEAFLTLQGLLDGPQVEKIDQRVRQRLEAGRQRKPEDLASLLTARARLRNVVRQELGEALLLLPTTAIAAPDLAALETDDEHFARTNALVLRNTMVGNFLDLPCLALPAGLMKGGLPASVMLCGSGLQCDEIILHAGRRIARILTGDVPLAHDHQMARTPRASN